MMHKKSPLPFIGQKKAMKEGYIQALKENFSDNFVFIDLFGGSCLCSHIAKHIYPNARVICNDYDDYCSRIEKIPYTNSILIELRKFMRFKHKQEKCSMDEKSKLSLWLQELDKTKGVDWITITSNLCFSMCQCKTYEQINELAFYNNVRVKNYGSDGYFNGFEVVRQDWLELFNQYKNDSNVCFIIDPPYFCTILRHYSNDDWTMSNTLDVMKAMIDVKNWIYFACDDSGAEDILNWLDKHFETHIMENVKSYRVSSQVNYNRNMEDVMYVSTQK
jgi:16S rRNA G966 N2-methylase RsmD